MNTSNFLTKTNISMIWDVISDEDIFKFLSRDIQIKISEIFSNNLKGFYETEVLKNNTLIDMNKKYIMLMLSFITKNYPIRPSKITILEEISPTNKKNLITYEEIHNDKKSQFEKDLSRHKEEFTNAMTIKVPPVPDFNDKLDDIPITEMEKKIKEMTAQRNYDVEQINKTFNYDTQDDNWLKPQETSIKNDKFQTPFSNFSQEKSSRSHLTNLEQKRNVTWGENVTKEFEEIEEIEENEIINIEIINNDNLTEENIFKKLKKVDNTNSNSNNEEMKKNILIITKRLTEMQEEMTKMQYILKELTKT